jgi:2'-5' RNA ligase
MPYAVTLPLDADAAGHIGRMWRALAEQAGADDAVRLGYRPHISLAVLSDGIPIRRAERVVSRAAEGWASFTLVLAGFGVFPTNPPVVWVAPVVTAGLLERHASLCADLAPLGIHPHYHPGSWVPHVTLSKEGPSLVRSIEVAAASWPGPISARFEEIELVQFRPVTVLQSYRLKPDGSGS